MTAIAMNYVVNPFANFGRAFMRSCEIIGYSRAAATLANQGLHEEAKKCMLEIAKLKK
jgi:hypothetical protein